MEFHKCVLGKHCGMGVTFQGIFSSNSLTTVSVWPLELGKHEESFGKYENRGY